MGIETVKCVIGANFGDEGKGLMTDYFAGRGGLAKKKIVVLHNGGAQRGHTVVTPEGYRHVFHHFGSGTYAGADTYMSEDFIVNPCLFRQEMEKFERHMPVTKIFINGKCKLTTIYDMLINQAIEADRGVAKHGSCGVGIYETLYRNQHGVKFANEFDINPLAMTVGEFAAMNAISKMDFLTYIRDWYVGKRFDIFGLKNLPRELELVLTSPQVIVNFIDDFEFMLRHAKIVHDEILNEYNLVIFESGQGLLLDQNNMDYFPHLSPSNTGLENPSKILTGIGYTGTVEACYVSRTYMTRHGKGRFDTECAKNLINPNMVDMTNVPNPFQDELRYGLMNWDELLVRVSNDLGKFSGNFITLPSIAITHMNEYGRTLPMDTLEQYAHLYLSFGMTRKEVWSR